MRRLRCSAVRWREALLWAQTFYIFFNLHNTFLTHWRKEKKHNRSPFTSLLPSFKYVLFDIRFDQIKGACWAMVEVCTLSLFKPEIDMWLDRKYLYL